MSEASALAGLRIVELGDVASAPYTGKLLADFGAEVVKVEPPEGDRARTFGPFPDDVPDLEASGLFLHLNTSKRGIVLDLETDSGRTALDRLLDTSDVFLTNWPLDHLRRLALDAQSLRRRHPSLIYADITPFGHHGPYGSYRGSELVTYAMGGLAQASPGMPDSVTDPEREPPLHPTARPADLIAGAIAASGVLLALRLRDADGRGRHVAISQQAAVASMGYRSLASFSYMGGVYGRVDVGPVRLPNYYLPCKDGYVVIAATQEHQWKNFVEAMGTPAWTSDERFSTFDGRHRNAGAFKELVTEWTMAHTGAEITELTQRRKVPCFAFHTIEAMADSAHVRERHSLADLYAGKRRCRTPGAPFHMSATPALQRRRAPRLNEHADEVFAELENFIGQRRAPAERGASLPLSGIRVLDFGQVIALPFGTQWMAWMGAEIILVESRHHMISRAMPPYAYDRADPNESSLFNHLGRNKLSFAVDLRTEEGRALVRRLVPACDVMVDNFGTGVIERMGFGYERVRELRPDIIMLSQGLLGRAGPLSKMMGLHSAAILFSGVADVTGYAGGGPRLLGGVLPDPLSGAYAILAILIALQHRARTGKGQYIDQSMFEVMTSLIPEAVIDLTLNGRRPQRIGNRSLVVAPHGIYRCLGEDAWIAIEVESDDDWRALCRVLERADWQDDPRLADRLGRLQHQDELDDGIEAWTRSRPAVEAMRLLQSARVPAGVTLDAGQVLHDPQLMHTGFLRTVDQPGVGTRLLPALPWRLSDSSEVHFRPAPQLGGDTHRILREMLGLGSAEIEALEARGVLQ